MSTVLQVESINVYYGSIHAVKDVSFRVEQGEVVTLIGANGAGKSTTLNTVAGLLHSRTGSVRFMGEELGTCPDTGWWGGAWPSCRRDGGSSSR